MAGEKIASFGLPDDERRQTHFCVKEAVMPFGRFPGADVILGPEMKSTGEVMGIANNFPSGLRENPQLLQWSFRRAGLASFRYAIVISVRSYLWS